MVFGLMIFPMRFLIIFCFILPLATHPLVGHAEQVKFEIWLDDFKANARKKGIDEETLIKAFSGITPVVQSLKQENRKPSNISKNTQTKPKIQPLSTYQRRFINPLRLVRGKMKAQNLAPLLLHLEKQYGVPGKTLLAFWGVETNFGSYKGKYDTVAALATLAWGAEKEKRRAYFGRELMHTLTILQSDMMKREAMVGSWAGAMGHPQFMPSSFLDHAQDFNQDGKVDLFTTEDALASMAAYLRHYGWRGKSWGVKVNLPKNLKTEPFTGKKGCRVVKRLSDGHPWEEWIARGIVPQKQPPETTGLWRVFSLSEAEGANKDTGDFLLHNNFLTILRYNCSLYYALTVGMMMDQF